MCWPVRTRPLVVVCDSDFGATVGQYPYRAERVGVAPLCAAELGQLAESGIGAAPDLAMSTHLQSASHGLAGHAWREIDTLLRAGRVRWSPDGVTLIDSTTSPESTNEARALLLAAVDGSDECGLDVIHLLACLDGPVAVETLAAILAGVTSDDPPPVWPAVSRLIDIGLLQVLDRGVDFRLPTLRAAASV